MVAAGFEPSRQADGNTLSSPMPLAPKQLCGSLRSAQNGLRHKETTNVTVSKTEKDEVSQNSQSKMLCFLLLGSKTMFIALRAIFRNQSPVRTGCL